MWDATGGCGEGRRGLGALTQPQGELVEALQLGDEGADGAPGPLLQPQVAGVLDGLWRGGEHQRLSQAMVGRWVGGQRAPGLHPPLESPARHPCMTAAQPGQPAPPPARRSPGSTPPSRPPSAAHLQGSAPGRETRRALSGVLGGESRSGVPAPRPTALPPARSPSWQVSPPGPSPCPSSSQAAEGGQVGVSPGCPATAVLLTGGSPSSPQPRAGPDGLQTAPGKRCGAIAPGHGSAPPPRGDPRTAKVGGGRLGWARCDGRRGRELKMAWMWNSE